MYPELFHIGGFTMNSFGVMMALAFISAGIVAHWQFKKRGVKPDFIYPVLIAAVIGGLLGREDPLSHPASRTSGRGTCSSGEGLVWFGGLFGAIFAVVLVTWVSKQRLAAIMDAGAIAVSDRLCRSAAWAASFAATTTACPPDLPWGMSFPKGAASDHGARASHTALRDRRHPRHLRDPGLGRLAHGSSGKAL